MDFEYLKSEFMRKYNLLSHMAYYSDVEDAHHEIAKDLSKGESYWHKWGDIKDLQHWVDDISEAVEMEKTRYQLADTLPDPVEEGYLCQNELL